MSHKPPAPTDAARGGAVSYISIEAGSAPALHFSGLESPGDGGSRCDIVTAHLVIAIGQDTGLWLAGAS